MGAMASEISSLTIFYSTFYSGADQRKHQSSASLAIVRGIHRWPVYSPHKGPVTRKMVPFDDVITIKFQQPEASMWYWRPPELFSQNKTQFSVEQAHSQLNTWPKKYRLFCSNPWKDVIDIKVPVDCRLGQWPALHQYYVCFLTPWDVKRGRLIDDIFVVFIYRTNSEHVTRAKDLPKGCR